MRQARPFSDHFGEAQWDLSADRFIGGHSAAWIAASEPSMPTTTDRCGVFESRHAVAG
jgi:hypothetical protein